VPAKAEKAIKARGGTTRYRTLKTGGKTMTCAITREKGPRGGKSVCWKKHHESLSAEQVAGEMLEDAENG